MRVAFPVNENNGIESFVFNHFGSATVFIIVDTETDEMKTVTNKDIDHSIGRCQPLKALDGEVVDAVVVGGIGIGALQKLNASKIRVFHAVEGTVLENLELIKSGKLPEFLPGMTCKGHGPGGQCVH
ncbi:MAG: NifB/NifX family molybdenum-iron cluster-binding protein [Desulfobacterales bacterium]